MVRLYLYSRSIIHGALLFFFFFSYVHASHKHESHHKKVDINFIKKFYDNFHSVQRGALYRSGQLSPVRLARYIKRVGIKSIINLRGVNEQFKWWHDEREFTQEYGIKFYNVRLSADLLPSKETLLELLDIYEHAPRPILIHCYGGADRTGEAAALWVLELQKKSKKEALKHLSFFKYRHISFQHPAKYFLINIWQGRKWLESSYDPKKYPQFCIQ